MQTFFAIMCIIFGANAEHRSVDEQFPKSQFTPLTASLLMPIEKFRRLTEWKEKNHHK